MVALLATAMPAQADEDEAGLQAYARGRLAESMGEMDDALVAYRLAFADQPDNFDIAGRSYIQAVVAGDAGLALQSARTLDGQASLPNDGLLLLLGDALGRSDWKQAEALLTRIRTANFGFIAPVVESWMPKDVVPPADPEARRSLTTERYFPEQRLFQALNAHDLKLADIHLPIALGFLPEGAQGLRLVAAAAYARAGKSDQALALLPASSTFATARTALANKRLLKKGAPPSVPAPVTTAAQGYARLLTRMALDLTSPRDKVLALRLARIASFADPASEETRIAVARLLGANDQAFAGLAELDRVDAASWFAPMAEDARIVVLGQAGREDDALTIVRARAAQPNAGSPAYIALAGMLDDTGDTAGAATAYARAIALTPDAPAVWSLWLRQGNALDRSGDAAGAITALKTAVKLAPNEPSALNMLGYTQIKNRIDLQDAMTTLRRASRLRNNDASILDSYGWALHLTGDANGAVNVLERAVDRAPANGIIQEHLGDAYWDAGRRFEARYAWRRAVLSSEKEAQDRLAAKLEQGLQMATAAP